MVRISNAKLEIELDCEPGTKLLSNCTAKLSSMEGTALGSYAYGQTRALLAEARKADPQLRIRIRTSPGVYYKAYTAEMSLLRAGGAKVSIGSGALPRPTTDAGTK